MCYISLVCLHTKNPRCTSSTPRQWSRWSVEINARESRTSRQLVKWSKNEFRAAHMLEAKFSKNKNFVTRRSFNVASAFPTISFCPRLRSISGDALQASVTFTLNENLWKHKRFEVPQHSSCSSSYCAPPRVLFSFFVFISTAMRRKDEVLLPFKVNWKSTSVFGFRLEWVSRLSLINLSGRFWLSIRGARNLSLRSVSSCRVIFVHSFWFMKAMRVVIRDEKEDCASATSHKENWIHWMALRYISLVSKSTSGFPFFSARSRAKRNAECSI